jgi:hypothetical protein
MMVIPAAFKLPHKSIIPSNGFMEADFQLPMLKESSHQLFKSHLT